MAVSAKAIKGKIGSVKNVGKITKAMELVSVSKMKRAVERVEKTRPYAREALSVLRNISSDSKRSHELLDHGDNGKNLIVLFSSNRGLCGSYNARVAKATAQFARRVKKHNSLIEFITVGKYAETAARRLGYDIKASFINFDQNAQVNEARILADTIFELYKTGEYFNVVIIYTNFISTLSSTVLAKQLLPIKPTNILNLLEHTSGSINNEFKKVDSVFEPSEPEVLDYVLDSLTVSQLFHAMTESSASEHSSRMVAMKNATENADKLAGELTLTYNRARQAGITQEISEIASGAEALSN